MKRSTLRKVFQFLLQALCNVEFIGLEHIPAEGGLIVTTNHLSRLDVPILLINPIRPEITALVADKYQNDILFGTAGKIGGVIWIDRSKADFTAFRAAVKLLKQGGCLGIATEGTRSKSGQLQKGKSGAVLLATKSNVPIVPVGISGSENAIRQIKNLHRPHIVARFGPAYRFPMLERENREAALQRYTDELMCRIAALLPEKYHGYYAKHPRLKELQQESSACC